MSQRCSAEPSNSLYANGSAYAMTNFTTEFVKHARVLKGRPAAHSPGHQDPSGRPRQVPACIREKSEHEVPIPVYWLRINNMKSKKNSFTIIRTELIGNFYIQSSLVKFTIFC